MQIKAIHCYWLGCWVAGTGHCCCYCSANCSAVAVGSPCPCSSPAVSASCLSVLTTALSEPTALSAAGFRTVRQADWPHCCCIVRSFGSAWRSSGWVAAAESAAPGQGPSSMIGSAARAAQNCAGSRSWLPITGTSYFPLGWTGRGFVGNHNPGPEGALVDLCCCLLFVRSWAAHDPTVHSCATDR